jgi:P27 family predicted phage terminase small subunit
MPIDAPEPPACVPNCPPHIQGEARKEWQRIGKELVRLKLVARIDKAALALYCQLWQRWIEAENAVRELGLVVTAAQLHAHIETDKGDAPRRPYGAEQMALLEGWKKSESDNSFPAKNPYLSIAESCMDRMQKILVEFGMTPSSRARVRATPADTTDEIEAALQDGSDDETERAHLQ